MKIETVKTIVIAVLISGIVSFVAGVHYQSAQNVKTLSQVEQVTSK